MIATLIPCSRRAMFSKLNGLTCFLAPSLPAPRYPGPGICKNRAPKCQIRSVRDFARKEWPLRGSPADVRRRGSYGRRVADDFCERCGDLLTGSNDCVDRVVLNAYFPPGHNPGGFGVLGLSGRN